MPFFPYSSWLGIGLLAVFVAVYFLRRLGQRPPEPEALGEDELLLR